MSEHSEHTVVATRITSAQGEARVRSVTLPLATHGAGCDDTLAPVELMLTAIAGAVLEGVEHAAGALSFRVTSAEVRVHGQYRTANPLTLAVAYDLAVATDEPDARFGQFHEVLRRSESMRRLGAVGADLTGRLRRDRAVT
jgi:uncharacterized OsmC-like protein